MRALSPALIAAVRISYWRAAAALGTLEHQTTRSPMKNILRAAFAGAAIAVLAACAPLAPAPATPAPHGGGKTELLWLGQSAFRITTPSGKVIVTDPWKRTNPATPAAYKDLSHLGHVDLVLVTHGHFDHIADAPALAALNT